MSDDLRAELVLLYLRQNTGVNSTNTLNISRRPRIIAAVQIQVCAFVRDS